MAAEFSQRDLVALNDIPEERLDWVWPNRIAVGAVTTLDGDPGQAKSTVAHDLIARLTCGRPMPNCTGALPPAGAVILGAEDGLGNTVKPRLQAAGADLRKVYVYDPRRFADRPLVLPDDLGVVEAAAGEVGAKLVMIDPFTAFLAGTANSERAVRAAIGALVGLAERLGLAVLLLRHLTKGGGSNPLYRGLGSIGVVAAARSALLAVTDPNADDPFQHVLAQVKTNLSVAPSLVYRTAKRGSVVTVEWLGESPCTAGDLTGGRAEHSLLTEGAPSLRAGTVRGHQVPPRRSTPRSTPPMSPQDALNPTLFRSLAHLLGEVRVAHPGEPFEARLVRDLATDRPRLHVDRYGEAYKVRCPYCRDRGFGLSVNHRYGTLHAGLGRPLDFLATCFAGGCLKDRDTRDDLFERLGGADRLGEARVRTGTAAPADPARLPASFTRLDRLRPNHPARTGLAALGHDPDRLGRVFGVGYCPAADIRLADERVVAPVRRGGTLVGWLAAAVTGDQIRFLAAPGIAAGMELYNLDRAKQYPAAVVVPSPDWVWRVGTAATAPLTAPVPERLAGLLRKALPGRDVIVLGTPDAPQTFETLARRLPLGHAGKVACVRLPSTEATPTRRELKRVLRAAAAGRGIGLTFTKGG